MDIKILGYENSKGQLLHANAKKAILALGIHVNLSKTNDYRELLKYGVLTTPCLLIDGEVRAIGTVLDEYELKNIIKASA